MSLIEQSLNTQQPAPASDGSDLKYDLCNTQKQLNDWNSDKMRLLFYTEYVSNRAVTEHTTTSTSQ